MKFGGDNMLYALVEYSTKQRFNKISSEEILGEVKIITPKIKEKNEKVMFKKIIKAPTLKKTLVSKFFKIL